MRTPILVAVGLLGALSGCTKKEPRKVVAVNGLPFEVTLLMTVDGAVQEVAVPAGGRVPLPGETAASFEVRMPNDRVFANGSIDAPDGDESANCTTFVNAAGSASIHKEAVAYGAGSSRILDQTDGAKVKTLCAPYNLDTEPPPEAISSDSFSEEVHWVHLNGTGDWVANVEYNFAQNSLNPDYRIGPWNILVNVAENDPTNAALPGLKQGYLASCDVLIDLDEQPSPFNEGELLVESPRKKCKRDTEALYALVK